MQWSILGVVKEDTRSVDCSSNRVEGYGAARGARSREPRPADGHLSYSLNSLKGLYRGDYNRGY